MPSTHVFPSFAFQPTDEQRLGRRRRRPVVVVGAGPTGLTMALDCAARGLGTLLVDARGAVQPGARAALHPRRVLEVWDRLGAAAPMLAAGVAAGADAGHKMPAQLQLQQYHVEEMLVAACRSHPGVDLRWHHRVVALELQPDHVRITLQTPAGRLDTEAAWVVACDGAHSTVRGLCGLALPPPAAPGRTLVAEVVVEGGTPRAGAALALADRVWRVDIALADGEDAAAARSPAALLPRLRDRLGPAVDFRLEWVDVHAHGTALLPAWRCGRVLFAGDAAHALPPAAAGAGVLDADNLGWKLQLVCEGAAPPSLLDSYTAERVPSLAAQPPAGSALNTPDEGGFGPAGLPPGHACPDAPVQVRGRAAWLLNRLGDGFVVLSFGAAPLAEVDCGPLRVPVLAVGTEFVDAHGALAAAHDAQPGTVVLLRPDQRVAARWRGFHSARIVAAVRRSIALGT